MVVVVFWCCGGGGVGAVAVADAGAVMTGVENATY